MGEKEKKNKSKTKTMKKKQRKVFWGGLPGAKNRSNNYAPFCLQKVRPRYFAQEKNLTKSQKGATPFCGNRLSRLKGLGGGSLGDWDLSGKVMFPRGVFSLCSTWKRDHCQGRAIK